MKLLVFSVDCEMWSVKCWVWNVARVWCADLTVNTTWVHQWNCGGEGAWVRRCIFHHMDHVTIHTKLNKPNRMYRSSPSTLGYFTSKSRIICAPARPPALCANVREFRETVQLGLAGAGITGRLLSQQYSGSLLSQYYWVISTESVYWVSVLSQVYWVRCTESCVLSQV